MSRIKLKDLTTKIGSGATPSGGKSSYIDAGISLIRSMNVYDFAFEYKDLAHINEQQAKKLAGVEVFPDDILINITGASVGRCCMVPPKVLPARVNQHVSIIRVRPNLVNVKFLLHYINEPNNKKQLLNIAQGGATREAITKEMLEVFEVELPSRTVQDRIASILSAYDDLIENNARRIAILEESAQRLYREWFVHFRFPGHEKVKMVDSEIGLIPKGWNVTTVGEATKRVSAGKKYDQKSAATFGTVPILDQGKSGFIGYHNDEPGFNASGSNPVIVFANLPVIKE